MNYDITIGIEVHAQLSTQTKLFCGCALQGEPVANTRTCPVCLGLPGALPVLNEEALSLALRAALALECEVQDKAQWSRKNYFYPDLPKGYQITQFHFPYAKGGTIRTWLDDTAIAVPLTRIHMEEDAGKSVHEGVLADGASMIDLNRAGTPLIEIVSEPAITSADEAVACFRSLRQTLRYAGVCDGNMEAGNLRCDVNISLKPKGAAELGTRTELKNLNSFRFMHDAIHYEVARQRDVLDSGGCVLQETLHWDPQAKVARSMRSKEDAHDYRYFPEPDLPLLTIAPERVQATQAALPELPAQKRARYVEALGLPFEDAQTLSDEKYVADYFDAGLAALSDVSQAKLLANWVCNEVLRYGDELAAGAFGMASEDLAGLVDLIAQGTISGKIGKEVFAHMLTGEGSAAEIIKARGLEQVSDLGALEAVIQEILAKNPGQVEQYRAGKTKLMGFFVGQVMKETQGKANPKAVNALLGKLLAG